METSDTTAEGAAPPSLRAADHPFSPAGLPAALLEFHSPSSALIALPPAIGARHTTWVVAAMAVASVVVMGVFPLDRVVSTSGRLVATDPTLVVQPFETSIVRSIDVHEGDVVRKGQVLARLDPTISTADLENRSAQVASYAAEVSRLTAEAEGRDYIADPRNPASVQEAAAFLRRRQEIAARIQDYDHQIAGQQSALQGALANAAMYAARARVSSSVLSMRRALQRDQVGSRLSTLGAQNDLMEIERAQVAAQQDAAGARNKISALIAQRAAAIDDWKATTFQQLAAAEHHLFDARSDLAKARLRGSLVALRADRDAVVLTIARMSVGSVVSTADRMMTLVPAGSGLEMEATLRGADAGFVRPGDKALLKFATFPYDQYGGADATVRTISADSFSPGNDGADAPGPGAAPRADDGQHMFYRVRLRIDRVTLRGVPAFFTPRPGLPATADIKVGKRTILQYLFNRIAPLATQGMREP
ncbi:major facilitator superfamily multidrug resistance transporter EmrA/FusE [Gluconacetobacter sacchari DSM 12717]|uniref:Membrane fusion protein (MFP) family protein n=2 Tax=Gluconacetobacter sacchari TaxID=92759 RepID=A0A7W4IFI0_9PROT|nr:HlyD family type I secretion periplasmic adaptor subunit [Gluconacetobacter sacchari]MBB2161903.1 HlyD family type I secretion periplasmic adaptor subunit [Gluconacetobacter sacchari]GBQ20654.1 major facilitator superfamily multidrug resistance transporter EmrA/FusE [Gluconacetobacter sacchari DSM 12717]